MAMCVPRCKVCVCFMGIGSALLCVYVSWGLGQRYCVCVLVILLYYVFTNAAIFYCRLVSSDIISYSTCFMGNCFLLGSVSYY